MLQFIFLVCAGLGSVIMLVQFALTLLGLSDDDSSSDLDGADGDFDAEGDFDIDSDGEHPTSLAHVADADVDSVRGTSLFKVLSIRSIIAAIAFFGLGGLLALANDLPPMASLALATASGIGAMYGVYWLMKQIYKLRASGNVRIANARGQSAKIYVPVPAENAGRGKIQISLQGRTMEYEAVTDERERLSTGENVVVVDVLRSDLVRVARVNERAESTV